MQVCAALFTTALLASATVRGNHDSEGLTVHEWGTFTSFQSEDGKTIAGINVDDEPVPDFVHRLRDLPRNRRRPHDPGG